LERGRITHPMGLSAQAFGIALLFGAISFGLVVVMSWIRGIKPFLLLLLALAAIAAISGVIVKPFFLKAPESF
jgi:hypothetical protein